MSWDIELRPQGSRSAYGCEPHEEGGTYAVGGLAEMALNVTYNYTEVLAAIGSPSFRELDGMTGEESVSMLAEIVAKCGTKQYTDYWAPTPGNCGYAASILLAWAMQHPEGIWNVN